MRNSYHSCYFAGGLVLFSLLFTLSGFSAPDKSSVSIHPQDSKIARLYIAMLDRDIEKGLSVLDPSCMFPSEWPKDASGVVSDPLPMQFPKSNLLRALELASGMAHAYRIPFSKWNQNPEILSKIQKIAGNAIQPKYTERVSSANDPNFDPTEFESYWLSLLTIYALVSDSFPLKEQQEFQSRMDSAIQDLHRHPIRKQNEQGMMWCTMMALASRVTGKSEYLQSTDPILNWLLPLVSPTGEYLDPSGLNLLRSARFIRSLFLYRLYSEKSDLDAELVRCLQWYVRLFSTRGVPLLGIQERYGQCYQSLFAQLLGPLTYYANRDGSFSQRTSRFMEILMDLPAGYTLESGGTPFLLGSVYHVIPDHLSPIPYTPYFQIYGDTASLYAVVGNNYQTAIMLNDPNNPKGMQVWSYRDQSPLIYPVPPRYTKTVGFGYDSCTINARSVNPTLPYKVDSIDDRVKILFLPSDMNATAYVFSQDTTVVIHRQPFNDATLEWIQDNRICMPFNKLSGSILEFAGSQSSLLFPSDSIPNFEDFEWGRRLRLHFKSEFCWYSLVGPDSKPIIQPVNENLIFVHLEEAHQTVNLLLNVSDQPFTGRINFPKTKIPVPEVQPWSVKWIQSK